MPLNEIQSKLIASLEQKLGRPLKVPDELDVTFFHKRQMKAMTAEVFREITKGYGETELRRQKTLYTRIETDDREIWTISLDSSAEAEFKDKYLKEYRLLN